MKVIYADGTPGELPDIAWLSIIEPVPGPITQAFGVRSVTGIWHRGEDRAPGAGTPIHAVLGARVSFVRTGSWNHYGPIPPDYAGIDTSYGGYGNQVTLDHDRTVQSHYGHFDSIVVQEGQYVRQGDVLGYIGSTGISTGPHLHYELRFTDGTRFDPQPYYSKPPIQEDDLAGFTDEEKKALHELAALHLDGLTFAPGPPGRSLLIAQMDQFRDLKTDAGRGRAIVRAKEAVQRWARPYPTATTGAAPGSVEED